MIVDAFLWTLWTFSMLFMVWTARRSVPTARAIGGERLFPSPKSSTPFMHMSCPTNIQDVLSAFFHETSMVHGCSMTHGTEKWWLGRSMTLSAYMRDLIPF